MAKCTCCCKDTDKPLDDEGVCTDCDDSFMSLLRDGYAFDYDINDFIAGWHDDIGVEPGQSLADFLGMTNEEYGSWVEQKKTPSQILADRKSQQ
jgi:hypothetical protein